MINPPNKKLIFFDCDSTLTSIEGLDEIAKTKRLDSKISEITNMGMMGKISFAQSFKMRMDIIKPTRNDVLMLTNSYINNATKYAREVIKKLTDQGNDVYIVSGGLLPALTDFSVFLGIPKSNVFGIEIYFDNLGNFKSYDTRSLFLKLSGKNLVVKNIIKLRQNNTNNKLYDKSIFIGDGITDLETIKTVDKVIIFTGHIKRPLAVRNDTIIYNERDFRNLHKYL